MKDTSTKYSMTRPSGPAALLLRVLSERSRHSRLPALAKVVPMK
jgi:hypothetical protein